MREEIIAGVIGLIAGLIIGFFTAKLRHNLELDRVYLAPFRKWCAEFYDELYEINKRYLTEKAQKRGYSHISDIQVIDDWRALHDISVHAMGWLARIQKEDEKLFCQFEELLRKIDEFWHRLETEHQFVLQSRKDIIGLGLVKQHEVADAILNQGIHLLPTQNVIEVLKYLQKKAPPENIFIRLWKRMKKKGGLEMALKAYVLIETEIGKTGDVAQGIQKVGGVESADPVTGSYDIVATIEVRDLDAVGALVKQLHSVPGICKTTTLIAVKY